MSKKRELCAIPEIRQGDGWKTKPAMCIYFRGEARGMH